MRSSNRPDSSCPTREASRVDRDFPPTPDELDIRIPFDPDEFFVPDDATCERYWDQRDMPEHIRNHSTNVALIATAMARRAAEKNLIRGDAAVQAVRSSALLHDLAKIYCITHGGHHSQLGAAWVMEHTGNPLLAQGVLHHVWWPFTVDPIRHFLPLAVLYADKRVRHDEIVPLGVRFSDLFERYGKNDTARDRIGQALAQSQAIENCFNEHLKVDLNACTFDCGRLVD
ncbi:hypothetical protein GGQ74_000702 [Desulfobaculum xiamenense]|uniref:HD domain-containing protein n=1 Tax=Desulfobaculum xiamenense TaxID=995050 RepID=A0A846QKT2_9BACT|nr:HD domain-containing protein [Desulfobaculum xiamenense]NJB67062.1 hypothetical protein [Desulfobaculum xiamenense]